MDEVDSFLTNSGLLRDVRDLGHERWAEFFAKYRLYVVAWFSKNVGSESDAEELADQVMMSLVRAMPDYRHGLVGSFRAYLKTAASNALKNEWRRRRRRPGDYAVGGESAVRRVGELADPNFEHQADEFGNSLSGVVEHDIRKRLLERLKGDIEPKTWDAVWRSWVDGQSASEIAEAIGMTSRAVYEARRRVRNKAQQLYEAERRGTKP